MARRCRKARPASTIADNQGFDVRNNYFGTYAQDTWRVTRKLTLDLGLRWEYEGPTQERYDRSVRGFDFNAPQTIEAAARAAYAAKPDPSLPVDQFHVRVAEQNVVVVDVGAVAGEGEGAVVNPGWGL